MGVEAVPLSRVWRGVGVEVLSHACHGVAMRVRVLGATYEQRTVGVEAVSVAWYAWLCFHRVAPQDVCVCRVGRGRMCGDLARVWWVLVVLSWCCPTRCVCLSACSGWSIRTREKGGGCGDLAPHVACGVMVFRVGVLGLARRVVPRSHGVALRGVCVCRVGCMDEHQWGWRLWVAVVCVCVCVCERERERENI